MTTDEALIKLRDLEQGDIEIAHCDADDILLEYLRGHDENCKRVAEAYDAACDRVGGFWYA